MLAVEDVVAEDQAHRVFADEFFADNERLGEAIRRRLLGIAQVDAELAAVAEACRRYESGDGAGADVVACAASLGGMDFSGRRGFAGGAVSGIQRLVFRQFS